MVEGGLEIGLGLDTVGPLPLFPLVGGRIFIQIFSPPNAWNDE